MKKIDTAQRVRERKKVRDINGKRQGETNRANQDCERDRKNQTEKESDIERRS